MPRDKLRPTQREQDARKRYKDMPEKEREFLLTGEPMKTDRTNQVEEGLRAAGISAKEMPSDVDKAKTKQKRQRSVLKSYNRLISRASSRKAKRFAEMAKEEYIGRTK